GVEQGFTAAEFKTAQAEGWEKQYQYKVGKKKVYMAPSQANIQGYERASKYPKSTKYGRQNPISERWNSEDQLVLWRAAWADVANRFLERTGIQERVDHRSHAARGLDEQPTIHEGVTARVLEQKGIISDRCELNRQIKADNALLRELKSLVKKLMDAVKNAIPTIAEVMEAVRQNMLIFRYQLLHIKSSKKGIADILQTAKPDYKRYRNVANQLKGKIRERRALLEEKKAVPAIQIFKHRALAQKITVLTEDIEELKSEKTLLLNQFDCEDDHGMEEVKKCIASMESSLEKLNQQETKYADELDSALTQYTELQKQSADMDAVKLDTVRQAIRADKEQQTTRQLRSVYGKRFDSQIMAQSRKDVATLLKENIAPVSIQQKIQQPFEKQREQHRTRKQTQER
ncbi:MAG: MobA/MobL family protein, partial [Oscillospiraceae bacterium]|nr:MobA/MobL family protein [Oscillospiraceae bacterium]